MDPEDLVWLIEKFVVAIVRDEQSEHVEDRLSRIYARDELLDALVMAKAAE